MKWLIVVLFALALGFVGRPSTALADHNGAWLPGDPANSPVQHRGLVRGYINVCFDQNASIYPQFKQQAASVRNFAIAKGAPYSREVPWNGTGDDKCDVENSMPDDATFVSACGSGAAGCIFYWLDPVVIYYRRSLGYTFWDSALCHEGGSGSTGHLWWLHEQYDDRNFRSDGKSWTCMDFGVSQPGDPLGRYVWALPDWDRDRIFNALVPDAPSAVSLSIQANGWATVSWSQFRKDGGAAHLDTAASPTAPGEPRNTNATRVAFGHSNCDGCAITWAGDTCGDAFNFCYSDYKDGQRSFDGYWHGCLYLRAENALMWWVPQVSAPNYWTKAGCW